jgi:signal transduction histidine kinase
MVVREAIYNAVRHGHPSNMQIAVHFESNGFELKIADDAIGFELAKLSSLPVGHYGLVGMQERIQRIGGRFAIHSKSGGGTEVVIQVSRGASRFREQSDVRSVL